VVATKDETGTARTIVFDVPGWPGHLAGQHVDVKLTAEDGYSAQRSYSIASAPSGPGGADGERLELTVQRIADGEVSPYLTDVLQEGDQVELRGPIGGWFVHRPDSSAPLLLLAGGSGVVPLMSMIRASAPPAQAETALSDNSKKPIRLIYSARTASDIIYVRELSERPVTVTYCYTRAAPPGMRAGRINAGVIAESAFPPEDKPDIFICGPTGFVEAAASLLIAAGHPASSIKTERFGPTN
jgi:ferredoxin-NADP reductase